MHAKHLPKSDGVMSASLHILQRLNGSFMVRTPLRLVKLVYQPLCVDMLF